MNESDLYNLSDEELETAFEAAKADLDSPDLDPITEAVDSTSDEVADEALEPAEIINDDPEQLDDQASDHNTSEEEAEDGSTEAETVTSTSDNPDGGIESTGAETTDESAKPAASAPQPAQQPTKFKANGKEYEFSQEEILAKFPTVFGQAMDYTKKSQALKPWRKSMDALEEAGLGHTDVNLMIDVLKGDKEAIAAVLKRTGTDALDLDTDTATEYVAKDYGRDESALAIKDIVADISKDEEYATTHSILSNEWDNSSWDAVTQDPSLIRLLHVDVKDGTYDLIQPTAEKLKVYDGARKSDLDYYKEAARQHYGNIARQDAQRTDQQRQVQQANQRQAEQVRLEEVKAQDVARTNTRQAQAKRKAAAPTRSNAGSTAIDYLDDSDDKFDEWYKNLQDNM